MVETIAKMIALISALFLLYAHFKGFFSKAKSDLKLDLEILNLLESDDPRRNQINSHISNEIKKVYISESIKEEKTSCFFLVVLIIAMITCTYFLWGKNSMWFYIFLVITILIVVISILVISGQTFPSQEQINGKPEGEDENQ